MKASALALMLAAALLLAIPIAPTAPLAYDTGIPDQAAQLAQPAAAPAEAVSGKALALMTDVFTENVGQAGNPDIMFHAASGGMAFTNRSAYMYIAGGGAPEGSAGLTTTIRLTFEGANDVAPTGMDPVPWQTNFIIGNESAQWLGGVRNYRAITYTDLWDGIDLTYRLEGGNPKYEFTISPFADPGLIKVRAEGQDSLCLGGDGSLRMDLGCGSTLTDSAPDAFYAGLEDEKVEARFVLGGDGAFTFEMTGRDPARAVVIDPLVYSTFLGGTGTDSGTDVAVGPDGAAYVVGFTDSLSFIVTPGTQEAEPGSNCDMFVSKIDPAGLSLEYSTFIGGSGHDVASAVAAGADGCAYLTGVTYSADFPTTMNSLDRSYGGVGDAFVARLAPDGSVPEYSTFLGGTHDEEAADIVVDDDGEAYVTGYTWSADFPTTEGANRTEICGDSDAFAAKLNAWGDLLIYSTFIGGTGSDRGAGIAVLDGFAYVAGTTKSLSFPVTNGSLNAASPGEDIFSAKVDRLGRTLVYSARFGGNGSDIAAGIAVDGEGRAYVTGTTDSANFPVTAGAFDRTHNGARDLFVTCINASGDGMRYCTYLGGSGSDLAAGISVDADGCAHVAGTTTSADLPTTADAMQGAGNGGTEAFIAKLAQSGGALLYSTYLGGSDDDSATGMDLEGNGCILVAGQTWSGDFPTTTGAPGRIGNGGLDTFVAKFDIIRPIADAGPDITVNESNTVEFNGSSSRDNVGIENYSWSFFDGESYQNLSGPAPSHFFRVPGAYNVTLAVADGVGNLDTDMLNLTVLVYPIPVAVAGADIVVNASVAAELNGSASHDNEAVTGYTWNFGDGVNGNITLSGPVPEWSFRVPGVYPVRLTVYDADDNTDEDLLNITVADIEPPVADPGASLEVPGGSAVSFNASSSSDDVGIVNYTWSFTNNGTEVVLYGADPEFAFWSAGTTAVTLTATDAAGNAGSDVMTVTVSEAGDGTGIGPVTAIGILLLAGALITLIFVARADSRKKCAARPTEDETTADETGGSPPEG